MAGCRCWPGCCPLARLTEVAIHHVDLDIGYEISDVDAADRRVAAGVVRLPAAEPGRVPAPRAASRFRLLDHGGQRRRRPARSAARVPLLGWLMGRRPTPSAVQRRRRSCSLPAIPTEEEMDRSARREVAHGRTRPRRAGRPALVAAAVTGRDHDQDQRRTDGQQRLPAAPRTARAVLIDAAKDHDRLLSDRRPAGRGHRHHPSSRRSLAGAPSVAAATRRGWSAADRTSTPSPTGAGVDGPDPVWDGDAVELGEGEPRGHRPGRPHPGLDRPGVHRPAGRPTCSPATACFPVGPARRRARATSRL